MCCSGIFGCSSGDDDNCKNEGKEGKGVNAWNVIATLVEVIASMGAGAASWAMSYEEKVPEALRK